MNLGGKRPNAGRKKGPQTRSPKMILAWKRRHRDAVENWKVAWTFRQRGMTFKNIGQEMGISESRAAVLCYLYEEELLNQKTKKAA